MARKLTIRVWILIVAVLFSILAINPAPWAAGIQIKDLGESSEAAQAGLAQGMILKTVNNQPIKSLEDLQAALNDIDIVQANATITTDQGIITFLPTATLPFTVENQTITNIQSNSQFKRGMKILEINNQPITPEDDIPAVLKSLVTKKPIIVTTDKGEFSFLASSRPSITASQAKKTNIKKGLDLSGGTRVVLKPAGDAKATDQQINDLISVLSNRLNVYGLSDIVLRPAEDAEKNRLVVIEIAGASREEVRDLIGQQGRFVAKIGNDTVFEGGRNDIPFVCRNDGSCAGVLPPCNNAGPGQVICNFQFSITLTEEAAQRHANVTGQLEVNATAGGRYLSKTIDFYLDDQLVDSLNIAADLKGKPTTQIAISGPGFGPTEEAAFENAIQQMNKLQTILITGSLPFKLTIEKIDTISPALGKEFITAALITSVIAILAVSIVVFLRYRRIGVTAAIVATMLSEIIIILGVAAVIGWNIDVASIAGILASIGTGVDHQIVIVDESMRGQQLSSWKDKIKRAFFIIFGAGATTAAAMLPLWNVGAGLVRGFAVTTIIGVAIGLFITRPAFASLIEQKAA